ncbi:MAG: S8 family serine peptidase [Acidobacteria bacterium]|nr:S8 family serine peptidase [Acidobacteriota bacterium]
MPPRPHVKRETKFEYTDKSTGKSLKFRPAADELVATFDESKPLEGLQALRKLDTGAVYAALPGAGFAVFRTTNMSAAAASLDATKPVANSLPVMIDDEGLRRYFLPDEFTVQFAENVSEDKAEDILQSQGASLRRKQRTPGYYTAGVPDGAGLFETIVAMSKRSEVLFAEPSEFGLDDALDAPPRQAAEAHVHAPETEQIDELARLWNLEPEAVQPYAFDLEGVEEAEDVLALPSDPHFGRLWGLHNTGQNVNGTVGSIDADIDAPQAWIHETGRKHVVVAVIDTGCDLDHPDLKTNILPRGSEDWDFADGADKEPWDSGSHGTHVAGTVAARRNGEGVVGVAYGCWVMPLRVNLTSGMNQNRADAINYVAAQAMKYKSSRRYVINCSWKMSGDHAGVRNAIKNAVSKNVVVVFAAGNANQNIDITPQYPAVYPEVMAVAATDQRDRRATFSNYGKKVDIAAPGVNIYSTVPDNTYGFNDGTSMASPHVAGVAALVWSKNPDLTNADVRTCVESSVDDIDPKNPGFGGLLGKGRLNALKAILNVPPRILPVKLLASYKFPQPNAGSSTGLTYVARFPLGILGMRPVLLFLTQKAGSERIHFLNPATGGVLGSVDPAGNDTIGSLAWDGSAILAANVTVGAGSINRINPFNGAQIGSIPAPPGRGEGLEVVGSRVYYSTIATIFELHAGTGAVLRSFPAPEGQCRALTFGRGLLFSAHSSAGRIVVFNPTTMSMRGIVLAPGGGTNQAEGVAFDSEHRILYVANQSENMIHVLRVGGV